MPDYKSAIYNDCWMVRHYRRKDILRRQAIQKLGLTLREAFRDAEDFEPLLSALIDGLSDKDKKVF